MPGRRVARFAGKGAGAVALGLAWLWSFGGVWFLPGFPWGGWPAWLFLAVSALILLVSRRAAVWWTLVAFLAVGTWYASHEPRNDREWRPELAVAPTATIDGGRVTVHDVRDFRFSTPEEFTPHYEDRSYDLARLDRLDAVFSFWDGNTRIAHTMLSFGFGPDEWLVLSVEVRRELHEGWGALPGIFRQFEVIYVLGDERDLLGQRTHARGEEVFVYPIRVDRADLRAVFLETLRAVNELAVHPDWYDTLSRNCFTSLIAILRAARPDRPPNPQLDAFLNGSVPAVLYQLGRIDTDLPWAQAQRVFAVTEVARQAPIGPDFSRRIRAPREAAAARPQE
ncbi:MAG TPA: DUF4105 domain-containing protein [Myxococcota bacterium]|nr:DUF4105 domain-containing protein [Myxococcota bacterium]